MFLRLLRLSAYAFKPVFSGVPYSLFSSTRAGPTTIIILREWPLKTSDHDDVLVTKFGRKSDGGGSGRGGFIAAAESVSVFYGAAAPAPGTIIHSVSSTFPSATRRQSVRNALRRKYLPRPCAYRVTCFGREFFILVSAVAPVIPGQAARTVSFNKNKTGICAARDRNH